MAQRRSIWQRVKNAAVFLASYTLGANLKLELCFYILYTLKELLKTPTDQGTKWKIATAAQKPVCANESTISLMDSTLPLKPILRRESH